MKRRGPKAVLSLRPELTEAVVTLLGEGVSIKTAANLCGVSERAYHEWTRRGQAGEEPYAGFFDAASRARDGWKARLISQIEGSAERGDWRASAFLLERQFPAEFGGRHEEGKRGADGLPAGSVTPIVNVVVHHDEASDAARKRFGTPPPNRTKCASLPMPSEPQSFLVEGKWLAQTMLT